MGRSTTKDKATDSDVIENLDGQEELLEALPDLPEADIEDDDDDDGTTQDDSDWDSLTENQKKARLRGRAQQTILDKYRDEFHDVAGKLFKEKGMEYRRKLTPRERAAQEVRRLIKEHNLRSEFPGYDAAASEAEPPEGTKVG